LDNLDGLTATKQSQSRYRVSGMDCAGCAAKVDTAVRRIIGVLDVSVSVTAATMTVQYDPATSPGPEIERKVTGLGYGIGIVAPYGENPAKGGSPLNDDGNDHAGQEYASEAIDGPWWQSPKVRLTAISGMAYALAFGFAYFNPPYALWFYTAAVVVGLIPIARRAFAAAFAGSPFTIEMLMSIAAVGAVIIGAGEEAAAVVFLFLVGELLEGVAAGRARASIKGLTSLVPKTAQLEQDGITTEILARRLTVGHIIVVRPGDRIPADGMIVSGESSIDEAPVTGESTPKRKRPDDPVFAGSINCDGALRVRVLAAAADNTIARIVRLVEEAQEAKAPTERFIDRFSRYYTPGVVAVATLVAIVPPLLFAGAWDAWVYKALAILLIGCPCAMVISTPAAIAAALSAAARRGLLLKGGAVLEQIGRVTMVAFDKTGTLTEGKPQVTDVIGVGRSEAEVMRLAASLEAGSNHPLAVAILARAAKDGIAAPTANDAAAIAGKGIVGTVDGLLLFLGSAPAAGERAALDANQSAQIEAMQREGKSVSVLVVVNEVGGLIAMQDEPRPDACEGIAALSAAGVKTIMLTGDNRSTAAAIAAALGIEFRAELLPQDKQRIVQELQQSGLIVAKVGDGINDAPALATAHVGIAMGGGTDVALETADAAVLHGRVGDVARMVDLSRRTMGNIRQNITVALGLKAVFLVTTIVGITGLWPAILADTGATVLVTMNALRLLRS
jgi:Cd2+/Zn2+-exporting ATPase